MRCTLHRSMQQALGALALAGLAVAPLGAQQAPFEIAAQELAAQLQQATNDLDALREQLTDEKLPLNRRLSELEAELVEARSEYQSVTREYENAALRFSNLQNEIDRRREEVAYVTNLFSDYVRNFESRLHRVEEQRYAEAIEAAKLAPEDPDLSQEDVYRVQIDLLDVSLGRLEDALDGSLFEGRAVVSTGLVADGRVLLVGPTALFRSETGTDVGTVEERLGSVAPNVFPLGSPEATAAAGEVVEVGAGLYVFDPTLGNALKIESTERTLVQEFEAGGPIMWPILVMAALALLVASFKFLGLFFVRKPSRKRMNMLFEAVREGDEEDAREQARRIRGPVGRMLRVGVEHLREPRDLIEEAMYETVLVARLELQRFLPFIAVCAASAPLLGLLGTVTGIINTFAMITVYGTGDPKTLSGGISEALLTTKFGLVVAIPSLLLHALLSRMAKSVTNRMETSAVTFTNAVSHSPFSEPGESTVLPSRKPGAKEDGEADRGDAAALREQLRGALTDILEQPERSGTKAPEELDHRHAESSKT